MKENTTTLLKNYAMAIANSSKYGFSACDGDDALTDAVNVLKDCQDTLEILSQYTDNRELSNALDTVAYFCMLAKDVKDSIKTDLYKTEEQLYKEHKDNNRQTVDYFYNVLSVNAKEWLRQQGYNNSEDLLDYIITDFNLNEDVTVDDCEWYVEDLLREEVRANGEESLYI